MIKKTIILTNSGILTNYQNYIEIIRIKSFNPDVLKKQYAQNKNLTLKSIAPFPLLVSHNTFQLRL